MQNHNHSEAPLAPSLVFEMLQAHQRTAALRAAIELDLFRAVGQGPGDTASIAKHCGASERGIRILCDFLAINKVLLKENGRYRHSPTSAAFLDPSSPACLASIARFLSDPALHEPYERLADVVRTGRTVLPGDGTVEPENPIWVQFAESMAPMMAPLVHPLGAIVLDGHQGPMRVLDIAAGHGLFGIEIARQNPQAHVTGLDWAPVLRVALDNARRAGVQDRYDMLPGSAFEVDFGGPYDAVLLTNFLHHFDAPTCERLLQRVARGLKPGGTAVTLEFVPNADRVTPPPAARFAAVMLATTAAGDAYTFGEYEAMFRNAGFARSTLHALPESPQSVILSVR
jgi:SAM-dependent methyltransferase